MITCLFIPPGWQFKLYNNVNDALRSVGNHNSKDKDTTNIPVPGNWQLHIPGDIPIYTNYKSIIPVDPPNVPVNNPTGFYVHQFNVSKLWKNRRNIICFNGVDSAFYIWCNSKFIGFSKDSRLPAEFDISDSLCYGATNTLEVVVIRYSDGYYLEDQRHL